MSEEITYWDVQGDSFIFKRTIDTSDPKYIRHDDKTVTIIDENYDEYWELRDFERPYFRELEDAKQSQIKHLQFCVDSALEAIQRIKEKKDE